MEAHELAKDDAQFVAEHIRIQNPTLILRGLRSQLRKQRPWSNRRAATRQSIE